MADPNEQMNVPPDERAFSEIATALMRLNAMFRKAGLQPVKSLELGSHEDGDRLRAYLPRHMVVPEPRQLTDAPNPEWVCNIVGVEVRFPGRWREYETAHRSRGRRFT